MYHFSNNLLWVNLAIFVGISAVICLAGILLQKTADTLALRTGLQRAFVGVLLLSAATSLPETAGVIGAAKTGDADLIVHTLMGATMTQMALLVVADFMACRRGALTHLSPQFQLLFQGVGLVMLLVVAMAGMSAGTVGSVGSISIWAILIFVTYMAVIYGTYRIQHSPKWQPVVSSSELPPARIDGYVCIDEGSDVQEEDPLLRRLKLASVVFLFVLSAVIILASGWTAAILADVLAVQTGLGTSFIGVTLLAFAVSTPELTIVISASRRGTYSLAISNIFGTNMYNVFLLVLAEVLLINGSIFHNVHLSAIFAAAVAAMIACVYLWGLLEHENWTIFRLGWDSAIVVVLFLSGYYILYLLR